MTETQYLEALKAELKGLPPAALDDIIRDYQEHFLAAREAGKTEAEVAQKLGEPRQLAKAHLASELITVAEGSRTVLGRSRAMAGVLKALLILAPLNFIVVLGPVLVIGVVGLVVWSVTFGIGPAAVGVLAEWFRVQSELATAQSIVPWSANASVFFLCLAGMGAAAMLAMIAWMATWGVLKLFLDYFRWNVRFVSQEGKTA